MGVQCAFNYFHIHKKQNYIVFISETDAAGNSSDVKDSTAFENIESSSTLCKLRRQRVLEKNAISYVTDFAIYLVYIGKY